ncbi:MAG TPA: CPBP family intramembrane metalloprotease [Candidatus Hydrogenedentes bacterium]|jgi:membrane protease YdiL (CAAX protease family)|nr:CPBP family intramembrane metalloprotease [Candidatus Hydrogenedentota bacterium]HPJ97965.1 CPBP family intramembrane metalloprotease [Candidatus Hydrogenedentota bacterium]
MNSPEQEAAGSQRAALLAAAYVLLVLGLDALATQNMRFPVEWRLLLKYQPGGFDVFKFAAWFALPLLCLLPRLDVHAFTFTRWRRADWYLLAGLAAMGALAVLLIPLLPGVREMYRGTGAFLARRRWEASIWYISWTASWLPGWELLHRYVLLRSWDRWLPRAGWLIVPLSEGVYHLQKAPLEALGMVALSIVLTLWARKRRNVLLPFLAHAIIELELLAFLLYASPGV